jgi:uncharacterized protein YdeI (YjbR/CyaY-like superfamily)
MTKLNPQVDQFLANADKWQQELTRLRAIVLESGLSENFKWRQPCYTYNNSNILIVSSLKDHCSLNFFKGALINDPNGILIKPGENTQEGRQIRFTGLDQIIELEPVLKSYIANAIEVEKAGLKMEPALNKIIAYPEELEFEFSHNQQFKSAFEALTPGRQRAYLIFFTGAKQSKSRQARIAKYRDRILAGKGIYDCVCGLSKKMPSCDGTHKTLPHE